MIKFKRIMKKIIYFAILSFGLLGNSFAASIEQYVSSVDKISATYAQDMRSFLRSLDPQLSQFSPEQQAKFCGIVNQYVEDMSQAIDKNRSSLTGQYATMTKQDIIKQITESKEMQMLKKYNVQCEFK